jgi:two-component system chemotaxis response regulator CheB
MPKRRLLIVDDAVVVRRILSEALSADPELEIAGLAANGRIALARIPQVNPDLVIMDVEMPEMDGLQALAELRKSYPRLPVIMFSTLTQRGAAATLDALALGADDYVTKPSNVGSVTVAIERVREELIPKIKHLFVARCARDVRVQRATCNVQRKDDGRAYAERLAPAFTQHTARSTQHANVASLVAIGVSTGGPNALLELLARLPETFAAPIVIVQHMPPIFTRTLAERLDARSPLTVREGADGEALRPGHVWIAPGGLHMRVGREGANLRLRLDDGPLENSCRPAVDVLFRSAAESVGAGVLAVVLTGMGRDGLRGGEAIREAGGQILVQDEASSVVWGMPGSIVRAGLADGVLPLEGIAADLMTRTGSAALGPGLRQGMEKGDSVPQMRHR